jgi:hypothetical protein
VLYLAKAKANISAHITAGNGPMACGKERQIKNLQMKSGRRTHCEGGAQRDQKFKQILKSPI